MEPKGIEPYDNPLISAGKPQTIKPESVKASVALCPPMVADADLRALIEAWPKLAEPIRAGILAMVKAAAKGDTQA